MSNVVVLEAVIVACFMVSAVAFVVTRDDPGSSLDAIDSILSTRARDFLLTAEDAPIGSQRCKGGNQLESLVMEGVQGDHGNFSRKRTKFFSDGVAANMYLDNHEAYYPLHVLHDEFNGSGTKRTWWPDWRRVLPAAQVGEVRGTESLHFDGLAIRGSSFARQQGEGVRVTAVFETAGVEHTELAWAPTALQNEPLTNITHITWIDGTSMVTAAMMGVGDRMALQLQLSSAGLHPERPTLSLQLAPGWVIESVDADETWARTIDAHTAVFAANRDVESSAIFTIYATPPASPARPFDVFTARMGDGPLHQAHMVVTYPVARDTSFPRELYVTMPYPLPFGKETVLGAVFANGGEEVVVTGLDIEIPGGYDLRHHQGRGAELFAAVVDPAGVEWPPGRWERISGKHLRWTPSEPVPVDAGGALSWQVRVLVTDDPSQETAIEPPGHAGPLVSLRLPNGYVAESTTWGSSPGIVRVRVPPDDPTTADVIEGYGAAAPGTYLVNGTFADVYGKLHGDGSYRVAAQGEDLIRLENSLSNSSIEVAERLVPLGQFARVEASLESVLSELAERGATETTLTFDLYPPPMLGCEPAVSWSRDVAALPKRAAHLVMVWDGGTGVDGSFAALQTGVVARFGSTGNEIWNVSLASPATAWSRLDAGPLASALLVGTADGDACAIETLTGALRWCEEVSAGEAVTAIAHDPATATLLAGAEDGALRLFAATSGALLASVDTDRRVLDALPVAGGWALLEKDRVRLVGSMLVPVTEQGVPGALAFAKGADAFLVATPTGLTRLASADLAVGETETLTDGVELAARGDLDGDGAEEMAVSTPEGWVRVYDGAGGTRWSKNAAVQLPLPSVLDLELDGGLQILGDDFGDSVTDWLAHVGRGCVSPALPKYGQKEYCTPVGAPHEGLQLAIEDGRVSYRHRVDGVQRVVTFDATGAGSVVNLHPAKPPTHHARGTHLGAGVVLVADSSGTIATYAEATGLQTRETSVSDETSAFTLAFRIPQGGFYGTHLVTATLEWTTQGGARQSARLLDWFEVVGSDGVPVAHPSYETVLVVADRGVPR